ncbi:hypothetical protein [Streptomyces carpinensis]|uniref:Uncharacterized protein n=1 Tax=Streptomyces carpinensis TaxID=66369 RepID=A0ABV1VUU1_9ACTN|nr:hypothetical protein [Streptomyces carpinensis]
MPVEPVPCAPGEGGTPGTCACAPSIASAPLCRPDGTTVLLVIRSECADCGSPAADPAVVGWIDPVTGVYTAGPAPADAGPCTAGCSCSPSITTAPLCRADGTTILVVVRSDCADCDTPAPDPVVVGWINLLTGMFMPGPAPADAGPCTSDCIDTVCRQLCDDTDGDGQADTTYSELWCIKADGTATLVLTYQDDPSTPYTPTSPVECTYGCPESETVMLCDDTGPFLRRYVFLNGTASYEDVALDGQTPHVVTGTVGACAGNDSKSCIDTLCRTRCDDTDGDGQADVTYSELWCVHADGTAELTLTYQDDPSVPYTPTSPVDCEYGTQASQALTLCDDTGPFLRRYSWLGDSASHDDFDLDGSTPHLVTGAVRLCPAAPDCEAQTTPVATLGLCLANGEPIAVVVTRDCDGTVTRDGWLNLTTGAYSAGEPPAGTIACGDSRSIQVSGTFCDVDPDTGDVLGLVLIEYSYDADGSIAAVRLVDAVTGQTYSPQGQVTTCPAGVEQWERDIVQLCDTAADGTVTAFVRDYARDENGQITGHTDYSLDGEPYTPAGTVNVCGTCHDCETTTLCDVPANTDPAPILNPASQPTTRAGTLSNGVSWTIAGGTSSIPNWWTVALLPSPSMGPLPVTFDRPVSVEWSARVGRRSTGVGKLVMPPGTVLVSLAADHVWDPATRTLSSVTTAGPVSDTAPVSRFMHPGPVTELLFATDGTTGLNATQRAVGDFIVTPVSVTFLRTVCRGCDGAVTSVTDTLLDGTTPYVPAGTVGVCQPPEPEPESCRDTSSTLLCDTAATDVITVFDPANRASADGWEVVSFTGANAGFGPEAAMPYPARYATAPVPALGARADMNAGTGSAQWAGYDAAPVRWVLRKTFQAPEDGVAVAQSVGFRGDGGARVRINGVDAGMYGQWNQPATSGTAQIPVTAGPNTVEIEVRDTNGLNYVTGRLDIALPRTTQFMRRTVVDCETGETVSVVDTTLDGEPYTVTGDVGQCEPAAECCEQPPPETRVDVETALLCVRDQASGEITGQVIAERVYDDQSGDLIEQRLTDLDGEPFTLPAGAELTKCPSPDRITRQVCVVESGTSEFLTNPANATSGVDADWTWAPNLTGVWYPMYRVAPIPAWVVTDSAPNKAHWVSPHADRSVCPTAAESSPPLPGTWYTRASWVLPVDVDPESIRISTTVLNADNRVIQWRLNDGAWQPVGPSQFVDPAWTVPPTAVPGGRAGQNDVVVQLLETAPPAACPNANLAGMILHVIATYDHAPQVWTQIIEPSGHTYYLDENGTRQDSIPPGKRLVPCDGGSGDAPCCPAVNTDVLTLCDTAPDGTVTTFLRHFTFTEGIAAPVVRDTALDGTSPYTPAGTVGTCSPAAEPCRNTTALLLCDQPTDGTPDPTVTDTAPGPYYPYTTGAPVTGGQTLWDGGTVTVPAASGPQPGTVGTVATLAATLAAPRPACDTGTAHVTVSVHAQQLGPDTGCAATGYLRLFNGASTPIALALVPNNTPVGWSGVLTAEADVPAADLAAGNIAALIALDTWDDSPAACPDSPRRTGWQLDAFTATVTYDQAGCAPQFLRNIVLDCESGAVVSVTDTTLNGGPYTPTGEPGQCTAASGGGTCCPQQPCGDTELAELCDLVYSPAPPTLTPASSFTLAGNVQVVGNLLYYSGGNVAVTGVANRAVTGLVAGAGYEFRFSTYWAGTGSPNPAASNAVYQVDVLDGTTVIATQQRNVSNGAGASPGPVPEAPVQFIAPASGAVTIRITDLTTGGGLNRDLLVIPQDVRSDVLTVQSTPFLRAITFDCDGAPTGSRDLALDGVTPYEVQGEVGTCAADGGSSGSAAPGPDTEIVQLCDTAPDGTVTAFLRQFTYEPGADAPTATDTALDGVTAYTPAGTVGVCQAEPCGDTEIVQLCDVTYDPQAPIPTPARDFTLTGNVVTANNGTILWFAQANQPANGVAELTVSGLLPATLYEFRFASAWIGAGAPDPANNNAIYRLDVLDGTTVLATRTRNTSNGSNVFPGGVLTEDLPPLAFIAPATGAVTIRFTDQTTGGAINDRDLFLMPLEVRTAVLTVTRTPFLRRFTFDCDGTPTGTQDLALDGVTPYEVQGEAGTCGGDGIGGSSVTPGPDTEIVQLCDVAADGTTTPFLRQLTYEPGADAPTVTDTALDGVTAYTPAGTVGTCQAATEGRDVELTPMCVIDNATGRVLQQILAEVTYDTATGDRLGVNYVDPRTWGPVALPGGAHLGLCPDAQSEPAPDVEVVQLCDLVDGADPVPFLRHLTYQPGATTPTVADTALDGTTPYVLTGTAGVCSTPCGVQAVIEQCRCDDLDADGLPDTGYVELLAVDCDGQLTSLGTYTDGLTAPYTPVSPVDCDAADEAEGAEPAFGVQAHRVELAAGQMWDAASVPLLRSVTLVARAAATVTTVDGTSTMIAGEAVTWSADKESDAAVVGPLVAHAGPDGSLIVNYTRAVTL